ncbi:anthranilate synthase component I family protein [Sporosarcina siberiensis]|uniref:Anthranilate synthase component I family protein n=1 Tax=Sporosarcina siberiensis TaxID=1365606 RepID=A0ABW4SBQ1_9BACL
MEEKEQMYSTGNFTREDFFYAYKELAQQDDNYILLESGRAGKLCIAGINPLAVLRSTNENELQITWRDGTEEIRQGESLDLLTEFVRAYEIASIPELPEFQGGVAGFISYDYVRRYEDLPSETIDDLHTPDLFFYLFDQWAVLDLETDTAYFVTLPESAQNPEFMKTEWMNAAVSGLEKRLFTSSQATTLSDNDNDLEVSVTGPEFEKMVRDVQSYINEDEVVQVNLSVRQSKPLTAHPLDMYEALRSFNPSPYMASIGSKNFNVVSGSPELLLKKRGSELSTRPIGGTRPRGMDDFADAAFKADLLSNEKEKSEHIMLVDLEREDLGRICEPDTVETNEFMVVEKYSHVMHLVSNVRGTAANGISNAEIVRGVFPGGTITGAPKLRTMEIIEELEPERRGLYTGAIGWFGFNGDFELNVVIRTAFIQDGRVYIQAGAGLVADSDPAAEYIESLNKATALWQAKEMAEEKVRR